MRRLLICLLLLVTACGAGRQESLADKDEVVVAIRSDVPLISVKGRDGGYDGFNIDVAEDLVSRLGKRIRWLEIKAGDQLNVLKDGRADLVFAHMSVTPERKKVIDFAGPYHVDFQDIAVRPADKDAIRDVRDLGGRRICWVRGTNIAQRIIDERRVPAIPVETSDYDACLEMMKDGRIDAISTNSQILAGLLTKPGVDLHLVGATFNEQRTSIGVRKGDVEGCEELNRAITQMYQDGTAHMLLDKWFGKSGIDLSVVAVPQFEGCS
ncbi:glutamate transport system substrate-binding protein [Nonomuraea solani]|uniref:Glutamate transport system substrate-binding protein n=1 Tax=Nonomuraea solani TaxID=1144553 RepID=A0A1H5W6M9_9ACTN|nr:transporter substrate-binding domain-containing protein [Nonomuraea solani]SEF95179.1 glutamate transport system substrate-binding protein [Nonomuraea solani]